jgi:hypothetical protein
MLQRRVFSCLAVLLSLAVVQSAQAEFFDYFGDGDGLDLGAILIGDEVDSASSTGSAPSSSASNPVTNVPDAVAANWVIQLDLDKVVADTGGLDIISVVFGVVVEGNTDPDLKFGIAHGGTDDAVIDSPDAMVPGTLTTYTAGGLVEFFELDLTDELNSAIGEDDYFRLAMTANPDATDFASASLFEPFFVVETVPEPSSFVLMALCAGMLGYVGYRRRK